VSEVTRIVDQLERDHSGDPWHGSSVLSQLDGVTATDAAARPPGNAHSIWEVVLHMTAWKDEVRRRLSGARAAEPDRGDWPQVGDTTPQRWAAAVADLTRAHEALKDAARRLDEASLATPSNDPRAASSAGATYYELLHGIAQHDAYHSGQIGLLRRLSRET
jgi:uncharacterized damage-inducible protein DinB